MTMDSTDARVIDFVRWLRARDGEDACFVQCPVCEGAKFAVVVMPNGLLLPKITKLVCTTCDPFRESSVVDNEMMEVSQK